MSTLVVGIASFLPWASLNVGMGTASFNAFNTNAGVFGDALPNWLVLAACLLVTAYAMLQYKGIADNASKAPVILAVVACLQAGFVTLSLMGTSTQTSNISALSGAPSEMTKGLLTGFPFGGSMTVHGGPGMVVALLGVAWLLVGGMKHLKLAKAGLSSEPPIKSVSP